jgi:hypothetical protein
MPSNQMLCEPCKEISLNTPGQREHARMSLLGDPTREGLFWILNYRCADCGAEWAYRHDKGPKSGFTQTTFLQ